MNTFRACLLVWMALSQGASCDNRNIDATNNPENGQATDEEIPNVRGPVSPILKKFPVSKLKCVRDVHYLQSFDVETGEVDQESMRATSTIGWDAIHRELRIYFAEQGISANGITKLLADKDNTGVQVGKNLTVGVKIWLNEAQSLVRGDKAYWVSIWVQFHQKK